MMELQFHPARHPARSCRWMEDAAGAPLAVCLPTSQFAFVLEQEARAVDVGAKPQASQRWRLPGALASQRPGPAGDSNLAAANLPPRGCLPAGQAIPLRHPDLS